MKESVKTEEVTLKLCTVEVGREEIAAALHLPVETRLLVDGKPIQRLTVSWLERPGEDGELSRAVSGESRPWVTCELCDPPRRIKGKGPARSHAAWHERQTTAAAQEPVEDEAVDEEPVAPRRRKLEKP